MFGIEGDGVGEICYKLLQGKDEPCESCPYDRLLKEPDKTFVWNHRESVKDRALRKTARIIDWPGGKKAHLEYAVDITSLMETEEALQHRGKMLDALNQAAIILLSQSEDTFLEAMSEGVSLIAEITGTDRMSVSRNARKPDGLYATHIFSWSRENGAEIPEGTSADKYTPNWEAALVSGECINGPARWLPDADAFKASGCLTAIAVPVVNHGEFWGFVLFEDRVRERVFTTDEADILRSASFMLANAVVRHEEAQKLRLADANAKRMMHEIDRKNKLLQAVNQVSSTMLASTAETFDSDLERALQIIAKAVGAHSTFIWENFNSDGELCCRQIYHWSVFQKARQEQALIEKLSYGESLPEWEAMLSKGQSINGVVSELSINEQAILVPRGVQSVIAMPIFLKSRFWGFISFDDCHSERRFSTSEESVLRSASELIAEAMVRHDMESNLHASAVELQRALNEAQSASLAKSEFLSSMSHEMRTPLNAVIGMTAIGLRSAEAKRKNYALEKIEEASTHLLGVINDILDMSKIESRKLELSPVEFNFEQMLQKVVTVISYRVNEKHQHFTISMDSDVPRFVIGDDQRLSQIITNLLANAVKFTPENGKIHLGVSLLNESGGINEIRVGVADSGIGVTPDQQAKLFKSFQQAESGISREYGGTGLGLAISKRIVEMMGGRIWVESEPGKGARFIFTVKLPNGSRELRSMLKQGIAWENVRVLVADGSGLSRRQFKDAFDRMEVQCETAADGHTFRHMIEKHGAYDIYFIDLYTPEVNGVRLAEWIRARGESGTIVLVSSSDWENLQSAVLRSGADKGLVKPILSSALVDCMNECLGIPDVGYEIDDADEFAGKSLLLAEDIAINREIVMSLLSESGLDIDCAENGAEALAMMEANPGKYDMIFMDMQMPVMDGLEATRRIRALPEPWCGEIPIIAMTANVFKDDISSCMNAGMNDHIGKPIDLDDTLGKLRKYLLNADYKQPKARRERRIESAPNWRGARLAEGTNISLDIRMFDDKGKRGSLSLPSVVEEVYPNGFFLIKMPVYHTAYYPLPRDEMFLIYFTAEPQKDASADMFVIPARFIERIDRDDSVYAKLEPLGKIERSQRRNCYRLPLSIAVSLKRANGGDDAPVVARMVNFSDGGMLVATDASLDSGEIVTLDFSIGDRETVRGVVLRTERVEFGRPKYRIAIEFSNADQEQKERFYKFIVNKQVEKASAIRESYHGMPLSLPAD